MTKSREGRKATASLFVQLLPDQKARMMKLAEADNLTLTELLIRMLDAYTPGTLEARLRAVETDVAALKEK